MMYDLTVLLDEAYGSIRVIVRRTVHEPRIGDTKEMYR